MRKGEEEVREWKKATGILWKGREGERRWKRRREKDMKGGRKNRTERKQ